MSTIRVELTKTNLTRRWPCVLCGGATEKTDVIAEAKGVGIVCECCLEQGSVAARESLARQADLLECQTADLRELAEAQWEMPTIDEFRDEEEVADALFEAEYTGWDVNRPAPPIAKDEGGTCPF